MLTWGKFKALLVSELEESDVPGNAIIATNSALRLFASHWAYGNFYTSRVPSSQALTLPGDYLEMHGVRSVADGLIMFNYPSLPDDADEGLGWYEFPHGTLHFPSFSGEVQIFYYSYYPEIEEDSLDTQPIPIPQWGLKGVLFMAAAYSIMPALVSDARLNQYNTRLDSGNPEHLPIKQLIDFLREQYEKEIAKWPHQERQLMLPNPRSTY